MPQLKQIEWHTQWKMFKDEEMFLFKDWLYPVKIEDFYGMDVLECGCGGGQHTSFIAPYAGHVTAVDLNTIDIAMERNKKFNNVKFVEADIELMDLKRKFDIVFSIGVVHHTNDPDKTVGNLIKHVKPGGMLILWVYSREGNFLIANVVEPLRKMFFSHLSRNTLVVISKIITFAMCGIVHTLYRLPCRQLPYYEYFQNFRKLSFLRNSLNVFDKLNAPQVELITLDRASRWVKEGGFKDINISSYKGVSWRISAVKL